VDHFYTSGTQKFVCVGHDRGARVGYRIARDHPERVLGLCVQDIVPTVRVFESTSPSFSILSLSLSLSHSLSKSELIRVTEMSLEHGHVETFRSYHWIFLALPSPLPETLINSNPSFYISHTLNSWTGSTIGSLAGGEKRAWDSWVGAYGDENVVEGALEDYRAGATIDLVHDAEDEGVLDCPILVLYSVHLAKRFEVGAVWEKLGERVEEHKVGDEGTGHFLPVEATEQTCEYMIEWMKKGGW
jgi:haloacetate dehalogenase